MLRSELRGHLRAIRFPDNTDPFELYTLGMISKGVLLECIIQELIDVGVFEEEKEK